MCWYIEFCVHTLTALLSSAFFPQLQRNAVISTANNTDMIFFIFSNPFICICAHHFFCLQIQLYPPAYSFIILSRAYVPPQQTARRKGLQLFDFGLNTIADSRPKITAAPIPIAEAVKPPDKTPASPLSATARYTPLHRL